MTTICTCDDTLYVDDDGVLRLRTGSVGLRDQLVFTSGGTFRKGDYPWLTRVYARVLGAGGAGGGTEPTTASGAAAGGGGGGGTYVEKLVQVDDLADVELVTVGGGGNGASDSEGGNGGFSAFGSHALGLGGQGGSRGPLNTNAFQTALALGVSGVGAQAGSIGDVIVLGGNGDYGLAVGSTSRFKISGHGGATHLAGVRAGRSTNGNGFAGIDGTGQGGSGAAGEDVDDAYAGGGGGNGLVILDLYG